MPLPGPSDPLWSPSLAGRIEQVRLLLQPPAACPDGDLLDRLALAADDPHWRVRRALLEGLRGPDAAELARALAGRLRAGEPTPRRAGVLSYLLRHVLGQEHDPPPAPPDNPARASALWDDDPAVLRLRLGGPEARAHRAALPELLVHEDEGVRKAALKQLRLLGSPADLLRCLQLRADPRAPFADEMVTRLLGYLNADRWRQLRALAPPGSLGERPPAAPRELTPQAGPPPPRREPPLALPSAPGQPPRRPLGATGLQVSPLGISGHYGLPVEGYGVAYEAGVNLFFWEPPYSSQTRFFRRLSPADRARLVVVCGTFEADPRGIRRDAERALRSLGLERISLFLLFWARSPARLQAIEALRQLQAQGLIEHHGVSTHLRGLGKRALDMGVPVLMTRLSAAHRGAEAELLPEAAARGAGMITFSNLCYGRMLRPRAAAAPTPADCYRYCLSQPGVSASLSAPRDIEQLRENLAALRDPWMPPSQQEALRAYGALVYQDNRDFMDWVRAR